MTMVCGGGALPPRVVGSRWSLDGVGIGQPWNVCVSTGIWKGVGSCQRVLPTWQSCLNGSSQLASQLSLSRPRVSRMTAQCNLKRDPQVLETWSMETTYDALASRLLEATRSIDHNAKYIVGLAGPPGAGKSTVAFEVVARLNDLWREEELASDSTVEFAVAVPMDGFHLYRWQLDAMQDPAEAHGRRGAPWTFDPAGLMECLNALRQKGYASFPSFDHGVGDPVEEDIHVLDGHKVVLVEGNYLLLNDGGWNALADIFDERWYVELDIDEAMDRVEKRHVLTGKPPEVAKWRIAYNDRPNAELIKESSRNADLLIQSVPLTVSDSLLQQ